MEKKVKIISVEIVEGKTLKTFWKYKMQKVYTDIGFFIDKTTKKSHNWKQDIGETVSVQIENHDGYNWINPCGEKTLPEAQEPVCPKQEIIDDEKLPSGYNINENLELEKTYDYIKQDIPVIFLTGGAGTGKSTFIKYLKNNLKKDTGKNYIILAPTGVAAINVRGQTIHSFFRFKEDIFEHEEINNIPKNPIIDHTDLIIIDEISMVSSWMLDHIDYALRLWCGNNKPFGGKQMLLIGDCFQLPPIVDDDKAKQQFVSRWASPFFFEAKVFVDQKVDIKAIQLKKIYRQKDEILIHMLNRIRKGQNGYERDIEFLNDNCFIETRLGTKNIPDECLLLTTKNNDAEKYNILKMFNLQRQGADTKTYLGVTSGYFNFDHFLTPIELELCVGAKVMVTKNISSKGLVNGDMGKIVDLGEEYVDVEIKGQKYQLNRETWQSFKYQWDEENKKIKQIPEGLFTQIPLRLGWAVTIHKSQGLTLDSVTIDAEDAWDSGQVYVALSRAKSLNGIILRKKIPIGAVKVNLYIKKIYSQLFEESEKEDKYAEKDFKRIVFDNSIFTIDKTKEIRSVNIKGFDFELYPQDGEKIQDHVKKTMSLLLLNKLIPKQEMKLLMNDKDYCHSTFGIEGKTKAKERYTLLSRDKDYYYDSFYNIYRCWKDNFCGYYICSQWYQKDSSKYAEWLLKLSKMT